MTCLLSVIEFEPPLPLSVIVGVLLACAVVGLVLRGLIGPPTMSHRSRGAGALRGLTLLGLLSLLFGPVHVDETEGPTSQPALFLLVDGSQSMGIGSETTRWDSAWGMLDEAASQVDVGSQGALPTYWFGHRLRPSGQLFAFNGRLAEDDDWATDEDRATDESHPVLPPDTDTRLADALQQLTSRFGRQQPTGVVVFSDGRVRDTSAVEAACQHYAAQGLPMHVVPLGDTNRAGDVAIVSVVAPERVRKYADVEVQVFFRSFGYTGERAIVEIVREPTVVDLELEDVLASVPVTLRGGAQSVTLTFRSGTRSHDMAVRIPPRDDEVSSRNNVVETHVAIDRTKIRVLYLEGSEQPVNIVRTGSAVRYEGAHTSLQSALMQDEDIACVSLVTSPDWGGFRRLQNGKNSTRASGFPRTLAELSAYDCVVLSSVTAGMLSEEQVDWLARWVENRGGGLWMVGGPDSFRGGHWEETPIADMLPVRFEESRWRGAQSASIDPTRVMDEHAIWKIVDNPVQNAAAIQGMPAVEAMHTGMVAKPAADVLMYSTMDNEDGIAEPLMVAGRYGRGRTMSTAFPITSPMADQWLYDWQPGGNRYAAKFFRNVIYWLTEGSQIGRRRLVTSVDKRFYRPGETVNLRAAAYDETASKTARYHVWAMIEPRMLDFDDEMLFAPVQWPNGVVRESGESGPLVVWGEEFELPRDPETDEYRLPLELAKRLSGQLSGQGLRIELTAYEESAGDFAFGRGTQVDSTSIELQILDDPFEQQNPFPNHDLLLRMASLTGGQTIRNADELATLIEQRPVEKGAPRVTVQPAWSKWWVWGLLIGLLGLEWLIRRSTGMA